MDPREWIVFDPRPHPFVVFEMRVWPTSRPDEVRVVTPARENPEAAELHAALARTGQ